MKLRSLPCFVVLVVALTLSASAWAQWSSDPNQNLALSDIPDADQVQPKVIPLSDNGFFVSWFNNNPNDAPPHGYDTYLQRLDLNGFEQFAHDGIQIAKLTNSSTEDYGADIDTQGNALLAFLDTRISANQQITVTKISPSREQLWGPNGVQLTSLTPNAHSPRVAGTSDGGAVVAWTAFGPTFSFIVLQKLDANGKPQWASTALQNNGIVVSENKADYAVCDLHASDNGSVIVSFSRDTGFRSNRYLYANKFSASGKLLWGAKHVKVWDGGSLQLGNFPSFLTDGNGGAVFAWYSSSPSLQVHVQHIGSDGMELFAHNGVVPSTNASQIRVSPSASYDASTQEIFVSYEEEDSLQSVSGVYAQKFDSTGTRQWGDGGLAIVPLQDNAEIFENTVQIGDGAFVFWVDQQVTSVGTLQGIRLNNDGTTHCAQFAVSSVLAEKSRQWTAQAANNNTVVAFQDFRDGNSNLYIQNVNPDCTLGIEDARAKHKQ
jgi:hypothetical protein